MSSNEEATGIIVISEIVEKFLVKLLPFRFLGTWKQHIYIELTFSAARSHAALSGTLSELISAGEQQVCSE